MQDQKTSLKVRKKGAGCIGQTVSRNKSWYYWNGIQSNPITAGNAILLLTELLRTLESNEPSFAQDHSH